MAADYYILLGIPYNATAEEIRDAYFSLARTLHPDANRDPEAREHFLVVQKAYETLANPQKRLTYDASLPEALRAGPSISLHLTYSRSVVPRINEPQLVYVLADLICTADRQNAATAPAHVCLVLDRSTSMMGARMDMVKSSALNLLQQLGAHDMLSVVGFSDRAEVIIPPTRASMLSKSDHRISLLQTVGGTEIYQGMLLGMEQLRKTDNSYIRHMILLTDGYTYGDDDHCRELAGEAAEEGISISTLGIGHEWNDSLMDQIASLSGGDSFYIGGARDLDTFLMHKLSELESVYARGLRMEFASAAGVELKSAFRLLPSISNLATTTPIVIGDLHYRKSISVLFEFVLSADLPEQDQISLVKGQLIMDIPGSSVPVSRIAMDFHSPLVKNIEPETPPTVIVEALAKLTLYRMQERIRGEVADGRFEKAARQLHYLATNLLSQGNRELAHTVLMEAEHIQQSRRFSGEGEKRIKYGTRALLLPSGPER